MDLLRKFTQVLFLLIISFDSKFLINLTGCVLQQEINPIAITTEVQYESWEYFMFAFVLI